MMLKKVCLVSVFVATALVAVSSAFAQDVSIGPIDFLVKVLGVEAVVPIGAALSVATRDGAIDVQLAARADLGDLQAKALQIAQALEMPKDNCADLFSPVVESVDVASITPEGDGTIKISIGGMLTVWLCKFGVKTKVNPDPEHVTLSGAFRLSADGSSTARLELVGDVDVGDSPILGKVAKLFKGQISDALRKAIGPGLDLSRAGASVSDVLGNDFHIDEAAFGADGDHVILTAKTHARLDGAQLTKILRGVK